MRYCRRRYVLWLASAALLAPALSAQQKPEKPASVSGKLYFLVGGPSNVPVYPRGGGPHEHWRTGLELRLESPRLKFFLDSAVAGAATFDNPDSVDFQARLALRVWRHFSVEGALQDAYALNALPPVDPAARRPTSSVNSTWVGPRWDFDGERLKGAVFIHWAIRGDEPLFFGHFTRPYAQERIGAELRWYAARNTTFVARPEVYWNRFDRGRGALTIGVERRVLGVILEVRASGYANIGVPPNTLSVHGRPLHPRRGMLFIGISIPFGKYR